MTIQQILDKRAAAFKAMEAVQKRSKDAGDWTETDESEYRAAEADFDKWDKMHRNETRLQELRAQGEQEAEQREDQAPAGERRSVDQRESEAERDKKALQTFFRFMQNPASVSPAELKKMIEGRSASGDRFQVFEQRGTAVIAGETTTTFGGYLIPVTLWTELERIMKAFGGMLQAGRVINTADGGLLNWPTNDDTAATGNWYSEPRSAPVAVEDMTFGRKQFNAFTWSTLAKFTLEIFQDENVGLFYNQFVDIMSERAGRALNIAFTSGNGTGRPTGLLDATNGAGTGKTAASATAITKAELIDLQHSVNSAYRSGPKVGFMMNDLTLAAVRKLDLGTTDSVPLWQPSMREGEPDRLLGKPYWINDDFPTIATGRKVIAFGDFSKFIIREVQRPSAQVLSERYMDELHRGVIMWCRYDSKLLVSQAIKLLQMA